MPKLSVIIPVYNAAKTVEKCIDSLLNQTLADLEVIIIDDHGQDNSIEIIQNQIAEHPRKSMFRFSKTDVNAGPGPARNVGLHIAQGEYVAFVDSDDWVEPDMYATLYETAIQHSADICHCDIFRDSFGKRQQRIQTTVPVQQGLFSEGDKRKFLANFRTFFSSYIYRREMLNTYAITFSSEKSDEDTCFLACSILCAQSMAQVGRPMYHYVYGPNSLSRRRNEKRYMEKLSACNRLLDFAKRYNIYGKYEQELNFIYIKKAYLTATLDYVTNVKRPKAEILREIYHELIRNFPKYRNNPLYKKHLLIRILVRFLHRMPRTASVIVCPILKIISSVPPPIATK